MSSSSSRSSTSGGTLVDVPSKRSGFPSPSVSWAPAASSGKASGPAIQLPLVGASGPSQTPSPSVSALPASVPSGSPSSAMLAMPSPSMSGSSASQIPSSSKSLGMSVASVELVKQSISVMSRKPSLSSSSSAMRPPGPSGSSSG